MEKLTLTKVYTSDKKKDGTPLKTTAGKPFWKVAIKTDKYGEEWMSTLCFDKESNLMSLKEGDEVTIIVTENEYGKEFKLPTKFDILETRVSALEARVRTLGQDGQKNLPSDYPTPESEGINPSSIPF